MLGVRSMTAPPRANSFVSTMLQQLTTSVQSLIRSEIRLATEEVKENGASMGIGGGMVAAGGLLGVYAVGLLLKSIVELLEEILPDWLAALVVGVAVGG